MLRAFVPGFVLGCFIAFAPSCGRECTPANCLGCCNENGVCAPGVTTDSCGVNGNTCSACVGAQTCGGGQCQGNSGVGGGAGTTGGGSGSTGGGSGSTGGGTGNTDTRNRVFVTSVAYAANLGGLTGADALCQNAATAANKGGTWKAFVSSANESALSRMAEAGPWFQEQENGGFVLTFNNKANLTTSPVTLLYLNEQGRGDADFPPTYWTGTLQTGAASSDHCNGWTTSSGSETGEVGTRGRWAGASTTYCSASRPLVCFEQSREPRAPPVPTTRKRVFVTSVAYAGNLGGLTGADALCQNAATAANKGGTWKAFVSSATESALSRMAEAGPWFQERENGGFVLTFNNKANLTTSPVTLLYLNEQGRGDADFPPTYWTGTLQTGAASSDHCNGWTTSSGSETGEVGTRGRWAGASTTYCSASRPLVCFEQ